MVAIFAFRQSLRTKRWENIWRIAPYIAITFETNAHLFNGTLDRFLIVAMICWDERFNYETAVISSNLFHCGLSTLNYVEVVWTSRGTQKIPKIASWRNKEGNRDMFMYITFAFFTLNVSCLKSLQWQLWQGIE